MKDLDRGNALFIILIAIALLGALSYAVMESGNTTGGDTSPEETKLASTALLQYSGSVKRSFTRLKALENYKWYEIDYGVGNTACASDRCKLFDEDGGRALSLSQVPEKAVGHPNSETASVRFVRVDGVGSDDPDLALMVFGLSDEICIAVNQEMGVTTTNTLGMPYGLTTSGNSGSVMNNAEHLKNTTSTTNPGDYRILRVGSSGNSAEVFGQQTFCFCQSNDAATCNETSPWQTIFVHVLEVR